MLPSHALRNVEALICLDCAIPSIPKEIERGFALGGPFEEGHEMGAASAEETEVGACVGKGEEEGSCVEAGVVICSSISIISSSLGVIIVIVVHVVIVTSPTGWGSRGRG